ncbi:MAG: hypothetical protein ACRDTG_05935, partial [Pseudonocardiaceae bacterium]
MAEAQPYRESRSGAVLALRGLEGEAVTVSLVGDRGRPSPGTTQHTAAAQSPAVSRPPLPGGGAPRVRWPVPEHG